jgi:membrane protein
MANEDAADRGERSPAERRARHEPSRLGGRGWWGALKRTVSEFREDDLTDWAAALTYYGVLSIFPALLVLVSILGLAGQSATQPLVENIGRFAPGAAQDIVTSAIENLERSRGGAGIALIAGLAAALWSASAYIGAFIRASNVVWDVEEGRPIWKTLPLRLGLTLLMLILLAVTAVAVVLTGPLAQAVGDLIGVGETFVTVWDIAKWPVLVGIVSLMFALLYWLAPNVRHPGFRWITPGGIVAVLLWIVASAAFAFYVATFGSYNKTYGSVAAIIIFLVWLWITNIAVLLGAEFDAEIERGRKVAGGHPADREPFLAPRDQP